MSFLGGAECSTAGNPLSQFTKHVQDDKSLQRDRLVGRGPGGSMQGMRSTGGMNMSGSQDNVSTETGLRGSISKGVALLVSSSRLTCSHR
jgi:peroxin-5